MVIKSLARGNFEHFWYIFTKIGTCGTPISPLDHCVILYYVFKTICGTQKTFAQHKSTKPLYVAGGRCIQVLEMTLTSARVFSVKRRKLLLITLIMQDSHTVYSVDVQIMRIKDVKIPTRQRQHKIYLPCCVLYLCIILCTFSSCCTS